MNATQNASRPRTQKATDQQLLDAYAELGSVYKVGDRLGLQHSSVHERLKKLGATKPINVFTEAERDRLRADYAAYRAEGRVSELAAELGRTVQFLSRQAKKLGLTDARHKKLWRATWKYRTDQEVREVFDDFKRSLLTISEYCERHGYDTEGMRQAIWSRWPDEWEYAIESAWPVGTAYRTGRVFEHAVRDDLRARGFHATRSNMSETPADVIAFTHGQILYVQCKVESYAFLPQEWNELHDIAMSVGAVPIMATHDASGSPWYGRLTGHKSSRRWEPRNLEEYDPRP